MSIILLYMYTKSINTFNTILMFSIIISVYIYIIIFKMLYTEDNKCKITNKKYNPMNVIFVSDTCPACHDIIPMIKNMKVNHPTLNIIYSDDIESALIMNVTKLPEFRIYPYGIENIDEYDSYDGFRNYKDILHFYNKNPNTS